MGDSKRNEHRRWPIAAFGILLALGVALPGSLRARDGNNSRAAQASMAEQVRHQLIMLPFYGVFDNLEFKLEDNGTVVLSGEVTRPILKSDAEKVAERVVGNGNVVNKIEVLPLSPFDDRIRIALYWRIFGSNQLYRYGLQAVPPIHIIVRNGNVTLTGVVASQADKNIAGLIAGSVPGAFTITNDLRVD